MDRDVPCPAWTWTLQLAGYENVFFLWQDVQIQPYAVKTVSRHLRGEKTWKNDLQNFNILINCDETKGPQQVSSCTDLFCEGLWHVGVWTRMLFSFRNSGVGSPALGTAFPAPTGTAAPDSQRDTAHRLGLRCGGNSSRKATVSAKG